MKLNLSFTRLYTPKIVLLLGRVTVLIITTGIAIGLIAALLPALMMASLQSDSSPPPVHRANGALGLTQTTNLTTTQILPLDPNAQNLELVGHVSATVGAFYVQQDYAYLAAGEEGLQVIDVSDPTAPTLAGTYEISGALVSVAVTGTVAVALDDVGNMLLLNVSTPAAPVELGRHTLPEQGNQVVIAGDYAYIPAGDSGLHIVDISTPDTPNEVGVYQTEGATRVLVAGDYAYLSANGLLHIIDITNPSAPTAIRSYRPLWGFGTRANVIENDRLYLTFQVGTDLTYVKIFDLSDPTVPIPIESELPMDVMEIRAYGLDLAVKDGKVYIPKGYRGLGLGMIDVSDPSRPLETGFYNQNFIGKTKIIAADDHVYVADPENGLYIFKPHPVEIPQPSLNVDLIGHFGGASNTVLVQDDYAYVSFGPEVAILDVSNPTAPRRIGYLVLPGQDGNVVNAITVVGTYAYVADNYGLWVVDVSEPTTPFVVGYTSCQCGVNTDVSVVGQYAYLTIYLSGGHGGSGKFGRGYFKVVDLSDPAHPFEVSTFETSDGGSMNDGARAVQVIDNYAYVADCAIYGLRVFDISNPADPIEVGNSRGGVEDFVLRDGYAYVTNGRVGGFRVIDVSDPTTLNSLGFYEDSWRAHSWDVALLDHYAYYADDPIVISSEPRGDYGLQILDISNPISPTATGFYTTATHITDLTIKDRYAYFTMQGSLHILDLSNPTHPVEIGAYQTPPSASKISVDDNHAYVVTRREWEDQELQVLDISNPAQPVTIKRSATDLGPTTPVVNGYAYFIDNGDLRILDVSNPVTLTQVGVYTPVARTDEIVTRGNFAYLASNYRLAVLDLSDPTAPTQVYSYTLPPTGQYDLPAPGLALIDDYLYLASTGTGLRIFDISEPSQLVEVKTDQEIAGEHLAVDNDYAYVATEGLQILDISDPASPTIVGATEVGLFGVRWSIRGIAVDDDYAYLIDDVVGLRVIDISNPTAPVEVGYSPVPGTPADLAVANDHIWVATKESGLFPFQLTPLDETPPSPNILQPLPPATPAPVLTQTVSTAPTPTSTPTPIQKSKNIDLVGSFEGSVGRILVQGDYAYAASGTTFKVLDISDRTRPQEIGRVELPGDIGGMTIVNDYAYVTCSKSVLSIVSLADLSNPTELGRYELESYSIYTTIDGDYAYLGDNYSSYDGNSGLHIVDISDPVSPSRVGFYPEQFAKYTTITDDYAYLNGSSGLHIIDVSDPISPSRVGLYSHPYGNSPGKVTVAGNYAYFTDLAGLQFSEGPLDGLQTIDISNPAHPVRVKANLRQHRIVAVTPDYLYVTSSDGLQRLDISNPFAPAVDIAIAASFNYIYMIEGDYAFLGEPDSLRVVDLSDPTAPTELGFYHMPESAYVLAVTDDYIYVNDGEDGLFILQFTGSTSDPTAN